MQFSSHRLNRFSHPCTYIHAVYTCMLSTCICIVWQTFHSTKFLEGHVVPMKPSSAPTVGDLSASRIFNDSRPPQDPHHPSRRKQPEQLLSKQRQNIRLLNVRKLPGEKTFSLQPIGTLASWVASRVAVISFRS